jgi:hypothetical protein
MESRSIQSRIDSSTSITCQIEKITQMPNGHDDNIGSFLPFFTAENNATPSGNIIRIYFCKMFQPLEGTSLVIVMPALISMGKKSGPFTHSRSTSFPLLSR